MKHRFLCLIVSAGFLLSHAVAAGAGLDPDAFTASHAPAYQSFPAGSPTWDFEDTLACYGASHALHPSVQYVDSGFLGYRFWMAYTPICISESDENPHIAVSRDGSNWMEFSSAEGRLSNPLFVPGDFGATHLSDPDILCRDDSLYLLFRVTWEIAGPDSHAVYLTVTGDGVNWAPPAEVLSDGLLGQPRQSAFLSPSLTADADAGYSLFVVEPRLSGLTALDTSRVVRYRSSAVQGPWVFSDTTGLRSPADSLKLWHLEIIREPGYPQLALLTLCPNEALSSGDSASLFVSVYDDAAGSWETATRPLLDRSADTSAWYGGTVYRGSGFFAGTAESPRLILWYSAAARRVNAGGPGTGWQTGWTIVFLRPQNLPYADYLTLADEEYPDNVVEHAGSLIWLCGDPRGAGEPLQVEAEIVVDSVRGTAVWSSGIVAAEQWRLEYPGESLIDGCRYRARLRVLNEAGWSPWTETAFRLNSCPAVPQPVAPVTEAVGSGGATLSCEPVWDGEGDPVVYDFELYADAPGIFPIATVSQGEPVWFPEAAFEENAPYHWRVRARDPWESSGWSGVSVFWYDAVAEAPSVPVPVGPVLDAGEVLCDLRPQFAWTAAVDPDPLDSVWYALTVVRGTGGDTVLVLDSLADTTVVTPDSLAAAASYRWRVGAFDADGHEVLGEEGAFSTVVPGDVSLDNVLNVGDVVPLVAYLFGGDGLVAPLFVADMDRSCSVNVADLTRLIDFVFRGGPRPELGCSP